ncbi:hypothetical protein [Sphaerisporangium corydalis]|uniref:Uncharacterized protein n=1 Tax=Sphaerisporangium corydalis TaxID=1441875 RepID=A0ABV9EFD0_9ACTN|nr:hypothetical protein [Sphaerisporangium corydalis]
MRSDGGSGLDQATAWSWTDPDTLAANAAGAVTPAQRALIIGPRIRPPYLAWTLLVALALMEAGAGVHGSTTNTGINPEGGVAGGVEEMLFIMIVLGWQVLVMALVSGVPRWGDRFARRRAIVAVESGRVTSAAGRVVAVPGGKARAIVGTTLIPLPTGSPELPPPGTYQLYWLEPTPGGPGPLLLSAHPQDITTSDHPPT